MGEISCSHRRQERAGAAEDEVGGGEHWNHCCILYEAGISSLPSCEISCIWQIRRNFFAHENVPRRRHLNHRGHREHRVLVKNLVLIRAYSCSFVGSFLIFKMRTTCAREKVPTNEHELTRKALFSVFSVSSVVHPFYCGFAAFYPCSASPPKCRRWSGRGFTQRRRRRDRARYSFSRCAAGC